MKPPITPCIPHPSYYEHVAELRRNGCFLSVEPVCQDLTPRRGDIATFRRLLDEQDAHSQAAQTATFGAPILHQHFQFHQISRLYGSYLYHQDRERFDVELMEWIEKGRPTTL